MRHGGHAERQIGHYPLLLDDRDADEAIVIRFAVARQCERLIGQDSHRAACRIGGRLGGEDTIALTLAGVRSPRSWKTALGREQHADFVDVQPARRGAYLGGIVGFWGEGVVTSIRCVVAL